MSRKEWLAVGLSLLLGIGFAAALPGAAVRYAGAESVIDDGPVTDSVGGLTPARWGDESGEQGEVEAPRWGDQSGESGIEAPRWGDQSSEQGEIESPRA